MHYETNICRVGPCGGPEGGGSKKDFRFEEVFFEFAILF